MSRTDRPHQLINPYASAEQQSGSAALPESARAAGRALLVGALGLGAMASVTGTGLAKTIADPAYEELLNRVFPGEGETPRFDLLEPGESVHYDCRTVSAGDEVVLDEDGRVVSGGELTEPNLRDRAHYVCGDVHGLDAYPNHEYHRHPDGDLGGNYRLDLGDRILPGYNDTEPGDEPRILGCERQRDDVVPECEDDYVAPPKSPLRIYYDENGNTRRPTTEELGVVVVPTAGGGETWIDKDEYERAVNDDEVTMWWESDERLSDHDPSDGYMIDPETAQLPGVAHEGPLVHVGSEVGTSGDGSTGGGDPVVGSTPILLDGPDGEDEDEDVVSEGEDEDEGEGDAERQDELIENADISRADSGFTSAVEASLVGATGGEVIPADSDELSERETGAEPGFVRDATDPITDGGGDRMILLDGRDRDESLVPTDQDLALDPGDGTGDLGEDSGESQISLDPVETTITPEETPDPAER